MRKPNAKVEYVDDSGKVVAVDHFYDPGLDPDSEYSLERKARRMWGSPHLAYGCGVKAIALAVALALNAGAALADDKPKPQTITLDNCAKVETTVQKVDRPNGTVWLQRVICTGDAVAPEVRHGAESTSSFSIGSSPVINGIICANEHGEAVCR